MQREMKIHIPDEIYIDLQMTEDELEQDLLQGAAIRYFLEKKLSLEQAAVLCGVSRIEFNNILYHRHIPFYHLPSGVLPTPTTWSSTN